MTDDTKVFVAAVSLTIAGYLGPETAEVVRVARAAGTEPPISRLTTMLGAAALGIWILFRSLRERAPVPGRRWWVIGAAAVWFVTGFVLAEVVKAQHGGVVPLLEYIPHLGNLLLHDTFFFGVLVAAAPYVGVIAGNALLERGLAPTVDNAE